MTSAFARLPVGRPAQVQALEVIATRITPTLMVRLRDAALANGRRLSVEIRDRLAESFADRPGHAARASGGRPDADPRPDPALVMTITGRTLQMNNAFRVAQIAEAAGLCRRNPEGFKDFVLRNLQWAEAEAIARDRSGECLLALPLLSPSQQRQLSLSEGDNR